MTTKTNGDSLAKLQKILGACLALDEEQLSTASFDGLKIEGSPEAIIKPLVPEQVGEVLCVASEFSTPVTTRGAGSSLTGGATRSVGLGFGFKWS